MARWDILDVKKVSGGGSDQVLTWDIAPAQGNIIVVCGGDQVKDMTPNLAALGFTVLDNLSASDDLTAWVAYKIAGASEPASITFQHLPSGSSGGACGAVIEYDLPTVNVNFASNKANAVSGPHLSIGAGSVTPVDADNLVVAGWVLEQANAWIDGQNINAGTTGFSIASDGVENAALVGNVRTQGMLITKLAAPLSAQAPVLSHSDTGNVGYGFVMVLEPPAADTTPPTLSSGSVQDDDWSPRVNWSTDEGSGTGYLYVNTSAAPPAEAEHLTPTSAVYDDTKAVSAAGAQFFESVGPLPVGVNHWAHIRHQDAASNVSDPLTVDLGDGSTTVQTSDDDMEILIRTTVENIQTPPGSGLIQFGLALAGLSALDDTQLPGKHAFIRKPGATYNFLLGPISAFDATGGAAERLVTVETEGVNYTLSVGDEVLILAGYAGAKVAPGGIDTGAFTAAGKTDLIGNLATVSDVTGVQDDVTAGFQDIDTNGVALADDGVAGIYVGTVGAGPTTTTMVLSGGVAFDGQHLGSIFKLLDGPSEGVVCKITASVAATNTVTFEVAEGGGPLASAPAQGNRYKIG